MNRTRKPKFAVSVRHLARSMAWALLGLMLTAGIASAQREDPTTFAAWKALAERGIERYGERWSVDIVDLRDDSWIFAMSANDRLCPASNRKIVTMALALEYLGPEFRFRTQLGLDRPIDPDRLHHDGDLILRSAGDPTMGGPFLRGDPLEFYDLWAADLITSGVVYVHGDLMLDASAFGSDQNRYPPEWHDRHRPYSYAAVPSALAVNENRLVVTVRPGARAGLPGVIEILPGFQGMQLSNETITSTRRGGGISAFFDDTGHQLTVKGRLNVNARREVTLVPLQRPIEYIGTTLMKALERQGVRLMGGMVVMTRRDPPGAGEPRVQPLEWVVGEHVSPPLNDLLVEMMHESDNFLAEQIWRATAAHREGVGDVEHARRMEESWLAELGLETMEAGWDGCGLSEQTRISAREMVRVCRRLHESAYRDVFLDSLARSGRDGTLRNRSFSRGGGHVRAKTGSMNGVSALTGFVLDRQGKPRYVFSIIGNAPGDTHGRLSLRINQLMKIVVALQTG